LASKRGRNRCPRHRISTVNQRRSRTTKAPRSIRLTRSDTSAPFSQKRTCQSLAKKIEYRARTTMIGLGSDGSAVKSIRLWWEHNKEAVLSRQYAKATWLPSASEQVSDNPIVIKANSSHRSDPLNPASASVLPPRPSTNPSLPSWIYAVAICGLGLIGGLWYRFRK